MEITVTDNNSKLAVNDVIFAAEYNEGLIHQVATAYAANARQATAVQKTRAEVRGGGAKPWKQKGTGRARAGTSRSPLWRSGGVTFASGRPNYKQKVNKKMYRGAIRSILSELIRQDRFIVVDAIPCSSNKTKDLAKYLQEKVASNVLIITDNVDQNLYLAARNLSYVEVCDVAGMNPMSLLRHDKVLLSSKAVQQIEELLG